MIFVALHGKPGRVLIGIVISLIPPLVQADIEFINLTVIIRIKEDLVIERKLHRPFFRNMFTPGLFEDLSVRILTEQHRNTGAPVGCGIRVKPERKSLRIQHPGSLSLFQITLQSVF